MNAEALFEQDFGLIAELIVRIVAIARITPALIKDDDQLTYGELDELMDRIAASLQRDGVSELAMSSQSVRCRASNTRLFSGSVAGGCCCCAACAIVDA